MVFLLEFLIFLSSINFYISNDSLVVDYRYFSKVNNIIIIKLKSFPIDILVKIL